MGMIEKRVPISKILLRTISNETFWDDLLIAPKLFKKIGFSGYGKNRLHSYQPAYIKNTLYRLQSKGFIIWVQYKRHRVVRLTPNGREKLRRSLLYEYKIKEPAYSWDGKWRIIIYDIIELRRGLRDRLRQQLQFIGFKQLQKSVWIFPYACEELIILLKADFKIGKDILYIVAEDIENDRHLRKLFNLHEP